MVVSTATGTSTNYTASTSVTYDTTDFNQPSYMALAFAMQDGLGSDASGGLIYYYFVPTGGYAPNGDILAHSDMVTGDWIYAYDAADRLISAAAAGNNPTTYQSMIGCWTYDAFGNRTMEAVSTTPCGSNPTPQVWAQYNSANNRITASTNSPAPNSFGYDPSGNTQNDGVNKYWYDAEGQLCAVQRTAGGTITQYVYDAGGARIAKGTLASAPAIGATCSALSVSGSNLTSSGGFTLSARYLVDLGGDQVTEMNSSGQWAHSNAWAGGKLTATYDTKGIHFELTDPLGSKRVQVNAAGQVDESCTSLPFGNDIGNQPGANCTAVANSLSTADDATEHHFTGKERDSETGNDYFGARYYASSMGRFMSPDWSAKEEPVPYAQLDDPQSLNLYSYVRNNPLARTDPDGHCCTEVVDEIESDFAGLMAGYQGYLAANGLSGGAVAGSARWGLLAGPAIMVGAMVHPATVSAGDLPAEDHGPGPEPQTSTSGAGARQGGNGTIYRVPGSGTRSGKPYIGRHNKPNPAKTRRSKDGRDRSQAEVVDTYNAADTQEGRQKEQQHIDQNGGVQNLDNKRNEINQQIQSDADRIREKTRWQ